MTGKYCRYTNLLYYLQDLTHLILVVTVPAIKPMISLKQNTNYSGLRLERFFKFPAVTSMALFFLYISLSLRIQWKKKYDFSNSNPPSEITPPSQFWQTANNVLKYQVIATSACWFLFVLKSLSKFRQHSILRKLYVTDCACLTCRAGWTTMSELSGFTNTQ